MRHGVYSLRARLTAIILVPTLGIALIAGLWQLGNARSTADQVFDRSLLSAALAVERDVAESGGDALSVATRDLLDDTSGGKVFYHVYAPDGVIVAGYATPPVGVPALDDAIGNPQFFDARYMGRAVRGVRLRRRGQIDGLIGTFTTTVWQDSAVRRAFVLQLVARSAVVITGLMLALALSVRFGVRHGLRPLTDLEQAIRQRSRDDLAPIRRPVPDEVKGIVVTLNRLFAELSRKMEAQRAFIANAAHQLRNPIAGVLSLAEAVRGARNEAAMRARAEELVTSAEGLARLAGQLLALGRADEVSPAAMREPLDLGAALEHWVAEIRHRVPAHVTLALEIRARCRLKADETMLHEAFRNIVENALEHGGPGLSRIDVVLTRENGQSVIAVSDDGRGLSEEDCARITERFYSRPGSAGSGLGLAIAAAVAAAHGGTLEVAPAAPGCRIRLRLAETNDAEPDCGPEVSDQLPGGRRRS